MYRTPRSLALSARAVVGEPQVATFELVFDPNRPPQEVHVLQGARPVARRSAGRSLHVDHRPAAFGHGLGQRAGLSDGERDDQRRVDARERDLRTGDEATRQSSTAAFRTPPRSTQRQADRRRRQPWRGKRRRHAWHVARPHGGEPLAADGQALDLSRDLPIHLLRRAVLTSGRIRRVIRDAIGSPSNCRAAIPRGSGSFTGNPVPIPIEFIDVLADYADWAAHVSGSVPAAGGAIKVAGDQVRSRCSWGRKRALAPRPWASAPVSPPPGASAPPPGRHPGFLADRGHRCPCQLL